MPPKKYKIKDIGQVVGGGTPSTSNPEYYGGTIPWLSPKDLSNHIHRYISHGEKNITALGLANSSAKIMPAGTILMSSRAPIGYLAIAANDICTNQGFKSIVPNIDMVDSEYLYYYLKYHIEEIKSLGVGTTFAEISGKLLENYEVELPELILQKRVSSIISAIDSKIELNQTINDNLLNICKTQYRQIINNSSKSILLSDLAEVCYGKDHKQLKDGNYPVYGSGGIMRYCEKPLYSGKESVLIPRKGTLNNVIFASKPFWSVDTMFYTKMKNIYAGKYLYFWLSGTNLTEMNTGSAVPSMTAEILNNIEIPYPGDQIIKIFDKSIQSLFDEIELNKQYIAHLTTIRDYILPKLISGAINIDDVYSATKYSFDWPLSYVFLMRVLYILLINHGIMERRIYPHMT